MHILYYSWQENTTSDFLFSMQALGHQVSPCMHELSYYFSDGVKSDIRDQLQAQTYDAVFTFNFFPLVSDMAESLHIPYICWVFDCPHYTLYSNSIRNSCNYLFLFDRDMCQSAIRRGARHAFHLPLAINTARLKEQLGIHPKAVCFVPILTCTIFHLSALSMKVPITVPSATRRTICAAIWQASLLPRRKCGESTSSRRFLLPDGSRNSSLSCPIPRRNMKC